MEEVVAQNSTFINFLSEFLFEIQEISATMQIFLSRTVISDEVAHSRATHL